MVFKTFKSCSVHNPKTNTRRNNLFASRFGCSWVIHACQWQLKNLTDVFKDVVSELELHAESKMIIFKSGPYILHTNAYSRQGDGND